MGLAASSARIYMLVARKSDLEFMLQMLNQRRMLLANTMLSLQNQFGMTKPGGSEAEQANVKSFEQILGSLQQIDKMLELQVNRINIQHQAVQTEIESVNKVVSKNIEMSFGLMGKA
ncbi:MAG: hypothetical protein VKK59_02320 [Vampirovibrionales bacterium]|nr:hypothetical protein [Vampirovibrionales bacterium]